MRSEFPIPGYEDADNVFLLTREQLNFLGLFGEVRADMSRDRLYYFNFSVYRSDVDAPVLIGCKDLSKLPDHVKDEVRSLLCAKIKEIDKKNDQI